MKLQFTLHLTKVLLVLCLNINFIKSYPILDRSTASTDYSYEVDLTTYDSAEMDDSAYTPIHLRNSTTTPRGVKVLNDYSYETDLTDYGYPGLEITNTTAANHSLTNTVDVETLSEMNFNSDYSEENGQTEKEYSYEYVQNAELKIPQNLSSIHNSTTKPGPQGRILGGSKAVRNEFPYQVHLRIGKSGGLCGGTILNKLFILTAAHCVLHKNQNTAIPRNIIRVTAGEHDTSISSGTEQVRTVSEIFIHKSFSWKTYQNDIALIVLSSPLELNENVASISYPRNKMEFTGMATVLGWGTADAEDYRPSKILKKLKIPIINASTCWNNYEGKYEITDLMICAGIVGKDACKGDSGGPLVCQGENGNVVCGVVSFGYGCAQEGFPGVYTKVSHYSHWIDSQIQKYMHDHHFGEEISAIYRYVNYWISKLNSEAFEACKESEFECSRTIRPFCIPQEFQCDGKNDCVNRADESRCLGDRNTV